MRPRRPLRRSAGGLLGLLVLVCGASAAMEPPTALASGAAGTAAPGVSPVQPGPGGYFEYTLAPGASTSGSVVVRNRSDAPATYDVYAADATTSPVTGVAYGESRTSEDGAASWIRLSTSEVKLAPGGHQTVDFAVTAAPEASPGQHVAAVGVQAPNVTGPRQSGAGGSSVSLVTNARVVVAVVVDVPGPAAAAARFGRPSVEVQQHIRQLISIPMANTGELLMKPVLSGTLRACGSDGSPVLVNFHRQLDTFVPHTAIRYPLYLDQALGTGCYAARIELTNGTATLARFDGDIVVGPSEAAVARPGGSLWGLPWGLAVGDAIALLLALGAFAYVLGRRRRWAH